MYHYFYLIKIQYLGFRYHGWQKQSGFKTVHLMVDKTLNFIFEAKQNFKTLGAGRTDAMVSAQEAAFELFLEEPLADSETFIQKFNYYLPQDIKVISVVEVAKEFNIIQDSKIKEYQYLFAFGQKTHPFCASIMTTFRDDLDIDLMKKGAQLFEGQHNFKSYCSDVSENGIYDRTIITCKLFENTIYTASFFPEHSYILKVEGEGFGYNQIRLMMMALVKLGKSELSLQDIENSLKATSTFSLDAIAPASGLILNSIVFKT